MSTPGLVASLYGRFVSTYRGGVMGTSDEDAVNVFERVMASSPLAAIAYDGARDGDGVSSLMFALAVVDARLRAIEEALQLPTNGRSVDDWLAMIKAGIDFDDEPTD